MTVNTEMKAVIQTLSEAASVKAAETLKRLTDKDWRVAGVALEASSGLPESFSGDSADSDCHAVFVDWKGSGSLIFMPNESAVAMARAFVFKNLGPGENSSESREGLMQTLGLDAIAEIGNIMAHSVATVWADACDMAFILSAPDVYRAPSDELRRRIVERLKGCGKLTLAVTLDMRSESLPARCLIGAVLSPEMVEKLSTASFGNRT